MAYYNIDPFGNERLDYQGAKVAWAVFETRRNQKKRKKPFEVKEFMPEFGNEKPRQTAEQQIAFARMITIGMGGTVKDGHR